MITPPKHYPNVEAMKDWQEYLEFQYREAVNALNEASTNLTSHNQRVREFYSATLKREQESAK